MRTPRQPAQDVLGADDRHDKRARGAVESSADKGASRSHQLANRCQEYRGLGGVLDHLERQHHVELLAGADERFGSGGAIIDR